MTSWRWEWEHLLARLDGQTFDNWGNNEPSWMNNEDCMLMTSAGWYARQCVEQAMFLCEYEHHY